LIDLPVTPDRLFFIAFRAKKPAKLQLFFQLHKFSGNYLQIFSILSTILAVFEYLHLFFDA